ncbi:MAG: helix-turn-helix domain-containing protein [Kiritimatiellales bacterium]
MYLGKQKLRLTTGTITISPAGKTTSYHVDNPSGGWHYTVCFSAKTPFPSQDGFVFSVPLYRPPTGFAAHESRLREIITLFGRGKKSELAAFAASNALLQLLLRISLYSHDTDPEDDGNSTLEKKLLTLENYIETQLEHALPVGDLAAYCDLSPDYLAQMFKKKHGVPLQRYILNRRTEKARHLLETTSTSIKEIGALVGFPDPQYFNKRFRLVVGRSPSAYRAHIEN